MARKHFVCTIRGRYFDRFMTRSIFAELQCRTLHVGFLFNMI